MAIGAHGNQYNHPSRVRDHTAYGKWYLKCSRVDASSNGLIRIPARYRDLTSSEIGLGKRLSRVGWREGQRKRSGFHQETFVTLARWILLTTTREGAVAVENRNECHGAGK